MKNYIEPLQWQMVTIKRETYLSSEYGLESPGSIRVYRHATIYQNPQSPLIQIMERDKVGVTWINPGMCEMVTNFCKDGEEKLCPDCLKDQKDYYTQKMAVWA